MKCTADRPILVVDDDKDIALAVSIALETAGFQVLLAQNGREGIELMERHRPSLVLLDMGMPVLDGRGFMREARAQGFDSPVVLMTAQPDPEKVAAEVGAISSLPKPFGVAELLSVVDRFRN